MRNNTTAMHPINTVSFLDFIHIIATGCPVHFSLTLLSFLFCVKSSNKETIPFLSIMHKNVNTNKGSPGGVHHLPSFPLQSPEKTTATEATLQQTTHTFVSALPQHYSSHHHHYQSAIM
ncbi:uncharacterized protein TM35_000202620 [Trypanosoma theileri]|uniref:Uncharacterized protein n=1 Tax=Trypanosoma theileri TaxID=67003 RepID=A0A1X0NTP8_9TRYP|nr:uncharacterized protein TM35_000202620 [Trypanosoma theileri]ORC87853.1 hypothetical protein TM35_000202620 [Trypanosoma theileri]